MLKGIGKFAAPGFVVALAVASPCRAQQTAPAPTLDAGATAALDRMAAYMRTLNVFRVEARTTLDEVLENGQKVQSEGMVEMLVRRPDRLRARITGEGKSRILFYDGKNFTLYGDRTGYYATAAAPPTIVELIDVLDAKYGIEMPLVDLYYWGTDRASKEKITSAIDVGPSAIDGTSCEQYAFRQEGLDWQIWIQQGPNPLPRKFILTTTDDDARPEYASTMKWDLAPAFNEAAFTFNPPATAKKIVFGSAASGGGSQ